MHRGRAQQTKRVGITGSSGKTTVTQALKQIMGPKQAFGSERSFNNHLGVPLTMANMPADTPLAFFEMGMNHQGELLDLGEIVKPHIGLITTIGDAHSGNFKCTEDIVLAKAELLAKLTGPKIAILPRDNQFFEILEKQARSYGCQILTFGAHTSSNVRVLKHEPFEAGQTLQASVQGELYAFNIPHRGAAFIQGALAILSVFHSLKLNIKKLLPNFMKWTLPDGRGSYHKLSWQGINIDLIDESYNANPTAMHATLKRFAENYPETPKILVLGDMKELGPDSPYQHQRIAEHAQYMEQTTCLAVGQDMCTAFQQVKAKHIGCADWQEACTKLTDLLKSDCAVLVKGSNGMQLFKVVSYLRSAI